MNSLKCADPLTYSTGGAPPQATGGAFFLWAPLFWEDHVTPAIFYDDIHGKPLIREGIVAPLYDAEPLGTEVEDGHDCRPASCPHRITYHPGTHWKGELVTGHESFDPQTLDMQQVPNFHTQQVVRVRDGSREGIGVLEQVVLGAYAPAGFTGMIDGTK